MNGDKTTMKTTTRREPFKAFVACLLVFSMTACANNRAQYAWHDLGAHQPAEMAKVSPPTQRWGSDAESTTGSNPAIAPGFLLALKCPDDAKLNGEFRVNYDGNLQLPYDTTVNTSGLTLSQLEQKLNETYRPYFKTSTGIKAHVQDRKFWVEVRGLVDKPGRFLVDANTSLDQILSLAGGISKEMSPRYVRIQKGSKNLTLDLNQYMNKGEERSQIASWTGGETVSFQRDVYAAAASTGYKLPVYVMGGVRKPGEYVAKTGTDFVDIITQADGFAETADLGRIEIIRRSGGRQLAYEFAWKEFAKAPVLQDGDVIFVHSEVSTRLERQISVGATIVAALATMVSAIVLAKSL
jgi:protein involved in polysaccharide export with SLBB domain